VGLADEFFLIAWDTAGSGAPLLHPRATSLGLAGALLGELALAQRITIWRAEMRVTDPRPVDDVLGRRVLHEMINAPEHTDVRTWLAYLARNSVADVAGRLTDAGLLRRAESRLLWRRSVRYLATNYVRAAWPAVRVEKMLVGGERMTPADMALAALVEATGLLDTILLDRRDRAAARRYLATFMATIPPPLRDLTGHVRAAVGEAVLSYRA
jgi:Golgi phosphoprotein 3 (GPP34)